MDTMKTNNSIYKGISIFAGLFFIFSVSAIAQWNIPDNFKNKKPSQDATYELVKTGKSVYLNKCSSCHEHLGKSDFLKLNPIPTDLGSEKFQKENNEGMVFYKLDEGMGTMPSFKHQLSETDKWCVVFYIKSFDENFEIKGEKSTTAETQLSADLNNDSKKIIVTAKYIDKTGKMAVLKDADIEFFVKRYFGNLPIGEGTTDVNGKTEIVFPDDIAGDSIGNAEVIIQFKDTDAFGKTSIKKSVAWANPVHYENLLNERHMWGNRASAPWWILITYFTVLIGVWAVILWVVFKITRIRKLR